VIEVEETGAGQQAESAKSRGAAEAKGRDAARLAVDLARSEAAAKAMAAELARVRKKAGPPPRVPTKSVVSTDSPKVRWFHPSPPTHTQPRLGLG